MDDTLKKFQKRLIKTALRHKFKGARFVVEQLDVALVRSGYLDRNVQYFPETAVNIVPLPGAASADLVQTPHGFQVGGAMLQNSKQACFALTQFLCALSNLLLQSLLGLAEFFLQRFLRRQIGDYDADGVCLRLKLRKRHEHWNRPAVFITERVFPSNALLSCLLQVFEKLLAHVRHDVIAKGNAARVALVQTENTAEVSIAIKYERVGRDAHSSLVHFIDHEPVWIIGAGKRVDDFAVRTLDHESVDFTFTDGAQRFLRFIKSAL